jgi:hypothetical protein
MLATDPPSPRGRGSQMRDGSAADWLATVAVRVARRRRCRGAALSVSFRFSINMRPPSAHLTRNRPSEAGVERRSEAAQSGRGRTSRAESEVRAVAGAETAVSICMEACPWGGKAMCDSRWRVLPCLAGWLPLPSLKAAAIPGCPVRVPMGRGNQFETGTGEGGNPDPWGLRKFVLAKVYHIEFVVARRDDDAV